jgi:aryl-alcohol dehydrogenase-like predicted oxidoreductase
MPLNPFDANFFSFEQKVLPVLHQRAIAPLGMKPIGGHGEPVEKGIFTAQELLRYAMSLAVATTITGVSDLGILKQNLEVAQGFTPLPDTEMDALRKRAKPTVAFQVPKLDVWQVHEVIYYNDPERAYEQDGVLEALTSAKQQGKVRFVGFTGHKNPSIHLEMLNRGFAFDTVQMPINPFDSSFRSFERNVLPVAVQKGMAVFSMKSMSGSGESIVHGALTPTQALSYALSVPGISTTISGMDSMAVLDQNLEILRDFKPLGEKQMSDLREHGRQFNDGRYELFKSTVKYDGDVGREQHNFPTAAELPA